MIRLSQYVFCEVRSARTEPPTEWSLWCRVRYLALLANRLPMDAHADRLVAAGVTLGLGSYLFPHGDAVELDGTVPIGNLRRHQTLDDLRVCRVAHKWQLDI